MNFNQKWNTKFRDTFLILKSIVMFVLGDLEISENKVKLAKGDKKSSLLLILSLLGVILLVKCQYLTR